MIALAPSRTLFPYTTLFRSEVGERPGVDVAPIARPPVEHAQGTDAEAIGRLDRVAGVEPESVLAHGGAVGEQRVGGERSEEHTSELQSRQYLVCRLLLEKKK